ncbi:MAG: ATP-binding cassette domain-containing protein, partial [Stellaceae bacterium]
MTPLLSVKRLVKHFPVKKGVLQQTVGQVRAVDGVSFDIGSGETLGLVGESGCGKSTVGKTILKLIDPTAGEVWLGDARIDGLSKGAMRPFRRQMQVVFQDPYSSLNPRLTVRAIVGEPLRNFAVAAGQELERQVR